jgi:hypothetical protein
MRSIIKNIVNNKYEIIKSCVYYPSDSTKYGLIAVKGKAIFIIDREKVKTFKADVETFKKEMNESNIPEEDTEVYTYLHFPFSQMIVWEWNSDTTITEYDEIRKSILPEYQNDKKLEKLIKDLVQSLKK